MIRHSRRLKFIYSQLFGLFLLIIPGIVQAGRPVTINDFAKQKTIRAWIYLSDDADYNEYFTLLEYPDKTQHRLTKTGALAKKTASDLVPGEELQTIISSNVTRLRYYSRILRAFSAEIDQNNFQALTSLPIVSRIESVASYVATMPDLLKTSDSSLTKSAKAINAAYETQLVQLNIPAAQALGFTGKGVRIGFIDTGFFKDHEVFREIISSGRLIAEYDFINDDGNVSDEETSDTTRNGLQSEHGTAVWSLVGGYNPPVYLGAAYGAEFLLAKTERIDTEIHREEDDFLAAVEWCDYWGADIVSVSLGYRDGFADGYEYPYECLDGKTAITTKAVNWAFERGILFVCCAGNDAQNFADGGLLTPGDAFGALTVGAVDAQGKIASFSSHGPTYDGRIKPDLCAMGVATYCAGNSQGVYRTGSGTSLATPLIAGAAALLLESQPTLSPAEIITELKRYADRAQNPDQKYGWGIPDVYQSIVSYQPKSFPRTELSFDEIWAYPNPTNSNINFYFIWHKATPATSSVLLQVFNLSGQVVFEKKLTGKFGGQKEVINWNLRNQSGNRVSSGIYFVCLQSPEYYKKNKFVIMY
ncbi:MAG TPA: S8 family serine peptidase [Candidatus Marinimicrobia bacterium]|nr:S8 family serine peptidase [Candidatus Neomarinimicrobiota bacterium]HRS50862.1 S8 family serine peptidase [Candidatus Neomarinimicrobiota bacterium]HRU91796.1 S8 family serine peptidase [Candidatus Neomarinimicrobiota bacterium]